MIERYGTILLLIIASFGLMVFGGLRWTAIEGEKDGLKRSLDLLRLNLICVGIAAVVVMFLLPSAPVLASFGRPRAIGDIQSPAQLLDYLQQYDDAIVRIINILDAALMIFVFGFLYSMYAYLKSVSKIIDELRSPHGSPLPGVESVDTQRRN
ncbi:hypothetical protein HY256_08240 [Candidatus Sumerlaeota bacterium]|nr:hypothetical protein [Candidatus Sumerlaeota bacterium]